MSQKQQNHLVNGNVEIGTNLQNMQHNTLPAWNVIPPQTLDMTHLKNGHTVQRVLHIAQ